MNQKIVETDLDINKWFAQLSGEVNVWITDPLIHLKIKMGQADLVFLEAQTKCTLDLRGQI